MRSRPPDRAVHQEQQLVDELAQRHHVGQVHEGDERDGDGPQPSRLAATSADWRSTATAARTPSRAGIEHRGPRPADQLVGQREVQGHGSGHRQRGRPARLALRPFAPLGPVPAGLVRTLAAGRAPAGSAPRGGVSLLGHRKPRYPGDLHRSVTLRDTVSVMNVPPRPYPWVRTAPAERRPGHRSNQGSIAMTHHADAATPTGRRGRLAPTAFKRLARPGTAVARPGRRSD